MTYETFWCLITLAFFDTGSKSSQKKHFGKKIDQKLFTLNFNMKNSCATVLDLRKTIHRNRILIRLKGTEILVHSLILYKESEKMIPWWSVDPPNSCSGCFCWQCLISHKIQYYQRFWHDVDVHQLPWLWDVRNLTSYYQNKAIK